jgi:hypothetical protein
MRKKYKFILVKQLHFAIHQCKSVGMWYVLVTGPDIGIELMDYRYLQVLSGGEEGKVVRRLSRTTGSLNLPMLQHSGWYRNRASARWAVHAVKTCYYELRCEV